MKTLGRSLPCNRHTLLCKGKAIVQSVSYLSNDLTCGLSPMDTSPQQPYLGGIVGMFALTVSCQRAPVCSQRWLSKGDALCWQPIQALDNAEMGDMLRRLGD